MRRLVFDTKSRLVMKRDTAALADMVTAERYPVHRLNALIDERSVALVLHAYRTTEYYRDTFNAAGFSEADLAQPQNFDNLPALTKDDVQSAGPSLASRARPEKDRLPSKTGGSTGRPLMVFNDRLAPTAALWWRIYGWWGIHPSDNAAFVYRQSRHGLRKLMYDAEWWPTRHVLLDARGTTAESVRRFEKQLARVRPALLVGYVEGVRELAELVNSGKLTVPAPRAVSVTASMLHPGQRRLIESALHTKVYDTYRSAEVPWIAAECHEQAGLHVLADRRRLDLVDGDGSPVKAGSVGDVLLTDFDNWAYPMIRYAIGDRTSAVGGACQCGRTLPRISALEGRVADVLRTPSGRIVSGGYGGLFNAWPGVVRQFQIHQGQDFAVTVRYVPGPDHSSASRAADGVVRTLSGFLNDEVVVTSQRVERIESVGGKARLVTSAVVAN